MQKYVRYLLQGAAIPLALPAASECRDTVVLVHGLLHRGVMMLELGAFLAGQGFRVYVYDYPTRKAGMGGHAAAFRLYLRKITAELPEPEKVHIVAHSMGGLITRMALADDLVVPGNRRGNIVMLAVPHGGSPVAAKWVCRLPRLAGILVRPLPELSDAPGAMPEIPVPVGWRVGSVIARFDRKVPAGSTAYAGEADRVTVSSGHGRIMNCPEARAQILCFIKDGKFSS